MDILGVVDGDTITCKICGYWGTNRSYFKWEDHLTGVHHVREFIFYVRHNVDIYLEHIIESELYNHAEEDCKYYIDMLVSIDDEAKRLYDSENYTGLQIYEELMYLHIQFYGVINEFMSLEYKCGHVDELKSMDDRITPEIIYVAWSHYIT